MQIIGERQLVRFKVKATSNADAQVELKVDRLPDQASFNVSADGTHIFAWQTNENDQGEHVFRITAADADNPDVQTSTDVMVIVGDPMQQSTWPADWQAEE